MEIMMQCLIKLSVLLLIIGEITRSLYVTIEEIPLVLAKQIKIHSLKIILSNKKHHLPSSGQCILFFFQKHNVYKGNKNTLCMHSKKVFDLAQTQKVLYNNTAYITFGIIRSQGNTFIVNF